MINIDTTDLNSGRVSALCAKGSRFNPRSGIVLICMLPNAAIATFIICCESSTAYYVVFFHIVNQRFCSATDLAHRFVNGKYQTCLIKSVG